MIFLHSRQHFNGNFLYFYFCKGWDACRFLHYQRNTNTVFCMAFKVCLSLTQCTYALQKAASINKLRRVKLVI